MIRLDMPQGSDEWRTARVGIATASGFADILAKGRGSEKEAASRRNLRAKLVVERLTGIPVQSFTSAAMQQGTEREPIARAAYESLTGEFVDAVGFLRHDEIEAGASPDGLIGEEGGIEIKCPELTAHLEYLRLPPNTCPAKYVAQVQGCIWISGRAWWKFASFNPEFPDHLQLIVRRIERDETYIAGLQLAVALFMEEVRAEEAEVRALPIAA